MDALFKDLRYALRLLVKSPGFSIVAALTLALGIGANTAIFTIVNGSLLKPLPIADADRLVSVFTTDERNPGNLPTSDLNYQDYRDKNQVFERVTAYTGAPVTLSHHNETSPAFALVVSGAYFDVLGIKPALGRTFLPEEDGAPDAHPVAVMSHGLWERRFGSDPGIIGQTVSLNRRPFTIIGVAPKGFGGIDLGAAADLFVPMAMHAVVQPGFDWYNQRRGLFLLLVARLKPGVSVEQARQAIAVLSAQLEQSYPAENKGRRGAVVPMLEARLNPDGEGTVMRVTVLLFSVVGIVLLIACANLANLLLARGSRRRREVAIRLAIGASRIRLIRQLLTESIVLALVGGALGVLMAFWTLDLVRSADLGQALPMPLAESAVIDARVLTFSFVISLVAGVLFGLGPALQSSRPEVVPILKEETLPGEGGRRFSLRKVLIGAQVALSLLLLVGAGLFLRSLREAQKVDPGFQTDKVLVTGINLGRAGYTPDTGKNFYRASVDRLQGIPGVKSVALSQNAPFAGGGFLRSVFLPGQDTAARQNGVLVQTNVVGLRYFETLGIPVLKGRDFSEADREGTPPVVLINETMAARFWPGQDPVGQWFRFFGDTADQQVIGVVRDGKYNSLTENARPYIYQALLQNYSPAVSISIRTAADAAPLVPVVRGALQEVDRNLPAFNIRSLREQVDQSLGPERAGTTTLGLMGGLALLLASIGIYGITSYSVTQRTRELGIRIALGAQHGGLVWLIVRQGMTVVLAGLAAGLALGVTLTLVLTRQMSALLFGVSPADPITFAATSALLAAIALLANYVPARRATKLDPLIALRHE
jgi:putative ABC transport system permease protein